MKKTIIILATILISFSANSQKPNSEVKTQNDAFIEMMDIVGITEDNLGFEPKGYWTRYPDPNDIPYKVLAFNDLFAEPQYIYDFVKIMANSANIFLSEKYLKSHGDGLLKVGYYCGIRNATAQFRPYTASLWAELNEDEPLLNAIKEIYAKTNTVYRYNAMGVASDFPLIEKDLRKAIEPIHPDVQKYVARTVLNLLDAYHFREIAMRNVDWEDAKDCWRIRHLGETQFDGLEYYPQLEDAAQNIDMNSIYYAGMKLLQTSERLADSLLYLKKANKDIIWKNQNLNVITPIGRIVISGTEDNKHQYSDALLVVDIGGDDTYFGAVGSTPSLDIPVSLTVDLQGDDKYINEDEFLPSQGAAIFGAAMLLDVSGNDEYKSKRLSQGAAMMGIGILADMEGDDTYDMWTSGQGGAYFGVGLAIDNKGDDKYTIWGDGQGYGGVGGIGTLINRTGNDHYWAEPFSKNVFRPDYHSKDGKLNYSYAQGCGVGRRGDITDGHSWAGGMGTIIDIYGDDIYESANWSLGCGYWYGIGFAYDGNGNDKYLSASWTQSAGAHFCIGVLIDEAGNDEHICWEEQSNGLAFGHDYTIALFLNRGGDDLYKLKNDGLGYAINNSQVFFIDTDGDDKYITATGISTNLGRKEQNISKSHNFGDMNIVHNSPNSVSIHYLRSDQICFFADINGNDSYIKMNFETGEESDDIRLKNGSELFSPPAEEIKLLKNKRYFGLGKDFTNWDGVEIKYFRDKKDD